MVCTRGRTCSDKDSVMELDTGIFRDSRVLAHRDEGTKEVGGTIQ